MFVCGILAIMQGCTTNQSIAELPQSPNVLLIVIDTLRADYLAPYGAPEEIAPNLNRWATESVVFTKHYATSSWTRPGFATILTGLYPSEAGIYEEKFDRLPEEIETLPERMSGAGYSTFAINSNPNIDPYFGFDQGFQSFQEAGVRFMWMGEGTEAENEQIAEPFVPAEGITESALLQLQKQQEPWFGMLVYIDPHMPYAPLLIDEKAVASIPSHYHPEYAAEVHHADREIGRLLNALQKQGRLENTYVVITSDHGEGLWSHPGVPDTFEHGTQLYDSMNHVPLMVWHRDIPAKEIPNITSSISLFPTLLSLVGIDDANNPKRPSLQEALLTGKQDNIPKYAFSQTHWQRMNKRSVRAENGRYIYSQDAYDFQIEHRFEKSLPLKRQYLLEGPYEEFYGNPTCWISVLCWEKYKEAWSDNQLERLDPNLPSILKDWHTELEHREPLHRDPEDGYSSFVWSGTTMVDVVFHPRQSLEKVPPISEKMKSQLEQLGYME